MCFWSPPYCWSCNCAQSHASLSDYCIGWFDATGDIVTWERCCRSQERTSVTLSPILLLKHLPREGILFSSTTPVKVSAPVITSHARCAHTHGTDLHAIPPGFTGIQLSCAVCLVKAHQSVVSRPVERLTDAILLLKYSMFTSPINGKKVQLKTCRC